MCDLKKVGIISIVMMIIGQIAWTLETIVDMAHYANPAYFGVWSKLMMPTAGAPPTEFFIVSVVVSLIGWAIFACAYSVFGGAIKAKNELEKGVKFGGWIFLLATLPGSLSMYMLFNLPAMLLVSWTIVGLVLNLVAGVLAVKVMK
ncbi:MAG: hypothetical protein AABW86_00720 [Candidatus Micrarchaeota archaeon]